MSAVFEITKRKRVGKKSYMSTSVQKRNNSLRRKHCKNDKIQKWHKNSNKEKKKKKSRSSDNNVIFADG